MAHKRSLIQAKVWVGLHWLTGGLSRMLRTILSEQHDLSSWRCFQAWNANLSSWLPILACPEAPVKMITNPQQRADQYFLVSIIRTETSETSGRIGQVKIADFRDVARHWLIWGTQPRAWMMDRGKGSVEKFVISEMILSLWCFSKLSSPWRWMARMAGWGKVPVPWEWEQCFQRQGTISCRWIAWTCNKKANLWWVKNIAGWSICSRLHDSH